MPYKTRKKTNELILLEILNKRMALTQKDKQHYFHLKKGYEGEVQFDTLTEKLQCDCLILNDLLLEVNNTTFQIDSLIIEQDKVHFFEVKNFTGDYYFESDKLFKLPKKEVINPLHQLSRSESLLRQLLTSLGINPHIHASVVFINPTFTLYQAPLGNPIIFPTQVKNYLSNFNATPSKLTNKHRELADKLVSLHITDSRYTQIPSYDYDQLSKGIVCSKCHSFSAIIGKQKYICKKCQHEEHLDEAILRSIQEFSVLFPNKKITTKTIYYWCHVVPERRIRNTLLSNFTKKGNQRWSYFE